MEGEYQIFISYAWESDTDKNNKNVLKFVELLERGLNSVSAKKIKCFTDKKDLIPGDDVTQVIMENLKNSQLMIPLISPPYFTSSWCQKEWAEFEKLKRGSNYKTILPIEYKSVTYDDGKYSVSDDLETEEQKNFFHKVNSRLRTKEREVKSILNNDDQSVELLDKICRRIYVRLKELANERIGEKGHNHYIICDDLENWQSKKFDFSKQIEASRKNRSYEDYNPVAVIYTGGTIGMVDENNETDDSKYKSGNIHEVIDQLPKLSNLEVDVHFYSYSSEKLLDSSNIASREWQFLAQLIESIYYHYQGFVILHGANTMSYTASALSFMFENLSKPVILTGAEIPLTDFVFTDADDNTLRAIVLAAPLSTQRIGEEIPEVCILFGKYLLRGNRTTKKKSLDKSDGFDSPNYPALGTIDNDKFNPVDGGVVTEMPGRAFKLGSYSLAAPVFILEIYPEMDLDIYKKLLIKDEQPNIRGLIIKSYGPGNVPDGNQDFIGLIEKLVAKGVIVLNITQCYMGEVVLQLFENNSIMFDKGVVNGGDMTTEAAYCKLKYLLGRYKNDLKKIRRELRRSIRGERSKSSFSAYFGNGDKILVQPSATLTTSAGTFPFNNCENVFLRFKNIKLSDKVLLDQKIEILIFADLPEVLEANSDELLEYRKSKKFIASFSRNLNLNNSINHNLNVGQKIYKYLSPEMTLQIIGFSSERKRKSLSFSIEKVEMVIFFQN